METAIELHSPADKDFRKGILAFHAAHAAAKTAKERIVDAGLYFKSAQARLAGRREFGEFMACYANEISSRSVYNAINFAAGALEDAAKQKPELKGVQLELFAKQAVLKTPKNFTALMRDWGFIKDGARYHKDDYADRNLKRSQNGGSLKRPDFHPKLFLEQLDYLCIDVAVEKLSAREIKKLIKALTEKQVVALARLYELLPIAHDDGTIDV